MSDNVNAPSPDSGPNTPKSCRGPRRRAAFIVVLIVAAGLTGAAITSAFSRGPGFGPGFGHGFGPGHWHGGMMGESFDPAQAEDRADRMVRHMAIELDATDAQQDKLRAVVKAAVRRFPNDAQILQTLGFLDRRKGLFREATETLQHSYNIDPQTDMLVCEMAETHRAMRNYEAADRFYAQAISLADYDLIEYAYRNSHGGEPNRLILIFLLYFNKVLLIETFIDYMVYLIV